jgi:hypothetical protein
MIRYDYIIQAGYSGADLNLAFMALDTMGMTGLRINPAK